MYISDLVSLMLLLAFQQTVSINARPVAQSPLFDEADDQFLAFSDQPITLPPLNSNSNGITPANASSKGLYGKCGILENFLNATYSEAESFGIEESLSSLLDPWVGPSYNALVQVVDEENGGMEMEDGNSTSPMTDGGVMPAENGLDGEGMLPEGDMEADLMGEGMDENNNGTMTGVCDCADPEAVAVQLMLESGDVTPNTICVYPDTPLPDFQSIISQQSALTSPDGTPLQFYVAAPSDFLPIDFTDPTKTVRDLLQGDDKSIILKVASPTSPDVLPIPGMEGEAMSPQETEPAIPEPVNGTLPETPTESESVKEPTASETPEDKPPKTEDAPDAPAPASPPAPAPPAPETPEEPKDEPKEPETSSSASETSTSMEPTPTSVEEIVPTNNATACDATSGVLVKWMTGFRDISATPSCHLPTTPLSEIKTAIMSSNSKLTADAKFTYFSSKSATPFDVTRYNVSVFWTVTGSTSINCSSTEPFGTELDTALTVGDVATVGETFWIVAVDKINLPTEYANLKPCPSISDNSTSSNTTETESSSSNSCEDSESVSVRLTTLTNKDGQQLCIPKTSTLTDLTAQLKQKVLESSPKANMDRIQFYVAPANSYDAERTPANVAKSYKKGLVALNDIVYLGTGKSNGSLAMPDASLEALLSNGGVSVVAEEKPAEKRVARLLKREESSSSATEEPTSSATSESATPTTESTSEVSTTDVSSPSGSMSVYIFAVGLPNDPIDKLAATAKVVADNVPVVTKSGYCACSEKGAVHLQLISPNKIHTSMQTRPTCVFSGTTFPALATIIERLSSIKSPRLFVSPSESFATDKSIIAGTSLLIGAATDSGSNLYRIDLKSSLVSTKNALSLPLVKYGDKVAAQFYVLEADSDATSYDIAPALESAKPVTEKTPAPASAPGSSIDCTDAVTVKAIDEAGQLIPGPICIDPKSSTIELYKLFDAKMSNNSIASFVLFADKSSGFGNVSFVAVTKMVAEKIMEKDDIAMIKSDNATIVSALPLVSNVLQVYAFKDVNNAYQTGYVRSAAVAAPASETTELKKDGAESAESAEPTTGGVTLDREETDFNGDSETTNTTASTNTVDCATAKPADAIQLVYIAINTTTTRKVCVSSNTTLNTVIDITRSAFNLSSMSVGYFRDNKMVYNATIASNTSSVFAPCLKSNASSPCVAHPSVYSVANLVKSSSDAVSALFTSNGTWRQLLVVQLGNMSLAKEGGVSSEGEIVTLGPLDENALVFNENESSSAANLNVTNAVAPKPLDCGKFADAIQFVLVRQSGKTSSQKLCVNGSTTLLNAMEPLVAKFFNISSNVTVDYFRDAVKIYNPTSETVWKALPLILSQCRNATTSTNCGPNKSLMNINVLMKRNESLASLFVSTNGKPVAVKQVLVLESADGKLDKKPNVSMVNAAPASAPQNKSTPAVNGTKPVFATVDCAKNPKAVQLVYFASSGPVVRPICINDTVPMNKLDALVQSQFKLAPNTTLEYYRDTKTVYTTSTKIPATMVSDLAKCSAATEKTLCGPQKSVYRVEKMSTRTETVDKLFIGSAARQILIIAGNVKPVAPLNSTTGDKAKSSTATKGTTVTVNATTTYDCKKPDAVKIAIRTKAAPNKVETDCFPASMKTNEAMQKISAKTKTNIANMKLFVDTTKDFGSENLSKFSSKCLVAKIDEKFCSPVIKDATVGSLNKWQNVVQIYAL